MMRRPLPAACTAFLLVVGAGCASTPPPQTDATSDDPPPRMTDDAERPDASAPAETARAAEPPPAIQSWMDRLTVAHEYDPETGFIVAREVVPLPATIADGPPLDEAVRRGSAEGLLVIAFATADRCAPCQQYKRDALNDSRVTAALDEPALIVTHVEVDRQSALAARYLGGPAIPMTYAIRDGETVAILRGQRSADELLQWLGEVAPG